MEEFLVHLRISKNSNAKFDTKKYLKKIVMQLCLVSFSYLDLVLVKRNYSSGELVSWWRSLNERRVVSKLSEQRKLVRLDKSRGDS